MNQELTSVLRFLRRSGCNFKILRLYAELSTASPAAMASGFCSVSVQGLDRKRSASGFRRFPTESDIIRHWSWVPVWIRIILGNSSRAAVGDHRGKKWPTKSPSRGGAAMGDAGTNQQPKKMVVVTEAADARIRGVRFSYVEFCFVVCWICISSLWFVKGRWPSGQRLSKRESVWKGPPGRAFLSQILMQCVKLCVSFDLKTLVNGSTGCRDWQEVFEQDIYMKSWTPPAPHLRKV